MTDTMAPPMAVAPMAYGPETYLHRAVAPMAHGPETYLH